MHDSLSKRINHLHENEKEFAIEEVTALTLRPKPWNYCNRIICRRATRDTLDASSQTSDFHDSELREDDAWRVLIVYSQSVSLF